ncbi:Na+/H+ antiporter NhaD and related arsenite permeases [Pelotomaculum thermopropionicum SI]|uniref:Na+/H+ antiporter NhaD and related arsenite permeases n=1 Tax=Pelotomaculum thermopropionicum (strain DSM 13744 / JCM 10971 / SI) TaxID=370438 RepID=A5D532_PELTS|nr:Na+/H+ antiporter NhaD and related arsenite permeases [Pelotomaculum thermopropionicum SI]
MSPSCQITFASAVFLGIYALLIADKIHRTIVALCGAVIMLLAGIISQERAVRAIDFNTIGLLVGMMVIVGITRRTGIFEYLAVISAKWAKGEPVKIMLSLATVTAVLSAFLDNVTTVLLIVPVTFAIARQLKINPVPFLFAEIIASNIGGTATLIGDPPNIMIGSATGLGFMDFVIALTPVVIVVHIANMIWLRVLYKKQLVTTPDLQKNIMNMDEKEEIKDPVMLKKSLWIIGLTILGFVLHQYLHLESATIALSGAAFLLLVTRDDPGRALGAVEWPVIFFFAGLFVVVGALEEVGVIEYIAKESLKLTGGAMVPTGLLILWLSAIASAFVDNIPFVATMIPLIQDMGRLGGIPDLKPLWWSLSLGACLGGNGTLIGASANVVVAGLAEKRGVIMTFMSFTKVAFPMMLMSVAICTGYLLLRYLH